jgi:hypothetical protein
MASVAGGPRSSCRLHDRRRCSKWVIRVVVGWCIRSTRHLCALVCCRIFILVPVLASLGIARGPAHPDIATYAYTTALLGNNATERGTFGQTRELLRAEDLQDFGFDFEAVGDVSVAW